MYYKYYNNDILLNKIQQVLISHAYSHKSGTNLPWDRTGWTLFQLTIIVLLTTSSLACALNVTDDITITDTIVMFRMSQWKC